MTAQTLTLPYNRASPVHIQRRDLVLSSADSISLRVTIVESDDPSAQALEITGGIGGPMARLTVWRSTAGSWDYGRALCSSVETIWSGDGTIADAVGSFDFLLPVGTLAGWPMRCGWSFHLGFDGGRQSEMIAEGALHVRPAAGQLLTNIPLLTDAGVVILTD